MPGHVSAADAPEDLWRCHECGWTYPNHHPSAKHRRNHKKQCGKLPGFVKSTGLTSSGHHRATGSSEECSSDEEHHREHHLSSNQAHEMNSGKNGDLQELLQSPPPAAATNVEEVSCQGSNGSGPMPSDDGARDEPTIQDETALSTRNLDLPASKEVAEIPNGVDHGRISRRGSAHTLRGQWCCKHCGWAYSNPHPSAKNRRKHKKNCGLAAAHVGAGGSSDEASSDDGIESNQRVETQKPLKCDSGLSQGSLGAEITNGVIAKDENMSNDVEGKALADTTHEVPFESNPGSPQMCHGATSIDGSNEGHVQEKVDVEEAQVAIVDEERIRPPFEQAPSATNSSDVPDPLMDVVESSQSQAPGEIRNGTTSEQQESGELDAIVPDQQPLHVTTEQVDDRNPHLPHLSQPILTRENVGNSVNNQEKRDSTSTMSQSPVTLGAKSGRDSIGAPQVDIRNPQPRSATRTGIREDLTVSKLEEPNAPETQSPEGLVRSRVQVFEKLAQTSPQHLWKGISPTTNSGSPRQPRKNGITDTKASKPDAPNELQEIFSHLRHRGNFVQNELYMERA